jgi:Ca2+-binding EF-hand superfamily protein
MNLKRTGRVDRDEWVHYTLLAQSNASSIAVTQINSVLRAVLQQHPAILSDLQHMFELADTANTGWLTYDEVVDVYRRDVWRLRVANDGSLSCDPQLASSEPEKLASDIMEVMDLDSDGQISYTDFMSYCLGRRKEEVVVHMYDISNGLSSSMLPWILGEELEGIWHCGVVVFGKEYYFGGELVYDTPGKTAFGTVKKRLPLGETLWRRDELHAYIVKEMKPVFNREAYDTIYCNCNHFADKICQWLTGKSLPNDIGRQGEELMRFAATRAIVPILNRWLRNIDGKAIDQDTRTGGADTTDVALSIQGTKPWRKSDGAMQRGRIVTIQPEGSEGPVLGTLSGPDSQVQAQGGSKSATSPKPALGSQSDSQLWVTYFGPPTLSARGSRGRLCRELLPSARITLVDMEDVIAEGVYQNALGAIVGSAPSSASDSKKIGRWCKGSASAGLAPRSTIIPGSMRQTRMDSPRLSEHLSDDDGNIEEHSDCMEDLAEEVPVDSSFSWKNQAREHLAEMGYSPELVKAALMAVNWDVDSALSWLQAMDTKQMVLGRGEAGRKTASKKPTVPATTKYRSSDGTSPKAHHEAHTLVSL